MHVCPSEEDALRKKQKGIKRQGGEGGKKERIGFVRERKRIEIGEVRISSQGFGLWLEGREALLFGLVFDFSAPGFLPARQDAYHGVFGIGYFFQFFFQNVNYRLHEQALVEFGFLGLFRDSHIWGCGGNPHSKFSGDWEYMGMP